MRGTGGRAGGTGVSLHFVGLRFMRSVILQETARHGQRHRKDGGNGGRKGGVGELPGCLVSWVGLLLTPAKRLVGTQTPEDSHAPGTCV